MKHAIEEFSSVFSFGHSASSSTEEGDLCYEICYNRDLEYDVICEAVQILGLKYQEEFVETVLDVYKKNEILESKINFMSFVLSRCMKLSETPSLFSFLVVCTFIDKVVFCICKYVECFKIVKMASKCVIAAFYRWFLDVFDKENGFKGFSSYCEKLNMTVLAPCGDSEETFDTVSQDSLDEDNLDLEGFIPPDTDEVINLLKSFRELNDTDFLLTDFEKKLLYDRDDLTPDIDDKEDIFIPANRTSDSRKVETLDTVMKNLSIKSKTVLERVKHRCFMCEDNCYKHVVLVAKELNLCEI